MSDNKKYYWLKLKENFFDEKQIKYLRSLPDGDKLVITYLKMQLKSLKTEGFIKYDKILPKNDEELAMILDEDINIVKLTINALLQVKAIEILDDGSFYMIAMQNLIGKESKSAERVRRFRENQKQLMLHCNGDVTKCNTEIEIEKEIDNNNEQKKILLDHFSLTWKKYPNKKGRAKALEYYLQWIKGRKISGQKIKLTDKQIYFAVCKYAKECEDTDPQFIKHGDTFFNKAILDYVEFGNDE